MAEAEAAMLEIEGLVVRYGSFLAVDGVDLTVGKGEIVGIIGPNGAGKSSIVRAVAGLVTPAAGTIRLEGQALGPGEPAHRRTRIGISVVPEGRGIFPRMSVEENLLMGGYSLGRGGGASKRGSGALGTARMAANMTSCFELFPILRERRRQLAGTLSGGQQQMLAVAMGLMSDPDILLLDEPSLGLAPIVIGEIGAALGDLKRRGLTVLLAEQNVNLAGSRADRLYVLQTGRVLYHDRPAALFAIPEVVQSFLSI